MVRDGLAGWVERWQPALIIGAYVVFLMWLADRYRTRELIETERWGQLRLALFNHTIGEYVRSAEDRESPEPAAVASPSTLRPRIDIEELHK